MSRLSLRWGQTACVGVCILVVAVLAANVSARGPAGRGGMMGGMHGQQAGGAMGQQHGMMGRMGQQGMQGMGMNGQPGLGMGPMQGMMDDGAMQNMPEPMRMRMRMMMDMQVDEHDPAGLLAIKDELGLTREQILALNKILANARKQAAAMMTAPQRAKLRVLGKTPNTGRQMQRHLRQAMQRMQAMPGAQGMQGPVQNGAGRAGGHAGR